MPLPLGVLARAGAGAAPGAAGVYEWLETTILSSDQSSVTFSNLNTNYGSTYQHLQLRITARTSRTGADGDPLILQFNGDTASNYARHGLGAYFFGGSTTAYNNAAANQTSLMLSEAVAVANSTTNAFGVLVTDILDPFETTKFKTVRTLNGLSGGAWLSVELRSGLWRNTNAVTSIELKPLVGANLVSGSRFSLYGLKSS